MRRVQRLIWDGEFTQTLCAQAGMSFLKGFWEISDLTGGLRLRLTETPLSEVTTKNCP